MRVLKGRALSAGGGNEALDMEHDGDAAELGQGAMAMPATQVWTALFACCLPWLWQEGGELNVTQCQFVFLGIRKGYQAMATMELHQHQLDLTWLIEDWATEQLVPNRAVWFWAAIRTWPAWRAGREPFAPQLGFTSLICLQ